MTLSSHHRRGSVLIIVMVVVFAIAAMVLTLGRQVRTQALASANDLAAQKADAAERGAEQYVLSLMTDYRDTVPTLTETDFSAVPVGDAYFWIVRPNYGDAATPTWGVVDEASKLSLNTATYAQLMGVPGMTDEIANGIVAWRGATDTTGTTATTDDGTTVTPTIASSSSGTLSGGGAVKNAPFETVDELMLIPGMTRELLHGTAATTGEPTAGAASTGTTGGTNDWYLTHGLFDYFTVWSSWPNKAADGTARVSFNRADDRDAFAALLNTKLGDATRANEIVTILTPTTPGRRGRPGTAAPVQLSDIFDFAERAQLKPEEFSAIEDYVTKNSQTTTLKGLINVNTAPREILLALGTLAEADADTLISKRTDAIAQTPNSMAWVYDAIKDKAIGLGDFVCGTGRQFSADIVAASGNGRGFRRVRIVVDTTSSPARIVYRRDLTDQGWPMDPAVLDQLKAGTFAGGNAAANAPATGVR